MEPAFPEFEGSVKPLLISVTVTWVVTVGCLYQFLYDPTPLLILGAFFLVLSFSLSVLLFMDAVRSKALRFRFHLITLIVATVVAGLLWYWTSGIYKGYWYAPDQPAILIPLVYMVVGGTFVPAVLTEQLLYRKGGREILE